MSLSKPQLPNHLIRELMHIIRIKKDGESMTRMALSGKEAFPVFVYIVENFTFAATRRSGVYIRCSHPSMLDIYVNLKYSTEGSKCLAIPYVRDLTVLKVSDKNIPFGKIVQLAVTCYANSFTSILNSWADIEVLKIGCNSIGFLDCVVNGSIKLTNLRRLQLRFMSFEECFEFMSPTKNFVFPEVVTFKLTATKDLLHDLILVSTFPDVKHLVIETRLYMGKIALTLRQIARIVQCFTGLETVKLDFNYDLPMYSYEFANVVKLHDDLQNVKFPVPAPVEINFNEYIDTDDFDEIEPDCAQLKSIGYKEDGVNYRYVIVKEYGNVKLTSQVVYYNSLDNAMLTADEMQEFIEDRSVEVP